MDNFFQKLRDIQKKERNTGTLSEIDDSFYSDASNYLQDLLKMVNNNPLSLEAYQLRDAQRITTEICERREFKIVSTAATNVQKSHDIFKGHKKSSQLYDEIPFNTTPEEEEFYRKIVDMMVDYRENLMDKIVIDKQSTETRIGFKPVKRKEEDEAESSGGDDVVEDSPVESSGAGEDVIGPGPAMLDESQIAMMFGQAPDDILRDEDNNPVRPVRKDITTPFKGPEPPKEDTVTLQNLPADEDSVGESAEEVASSGDDVMDVIEGVEFDDFELVEFKEDIATDFLDENEKTYGPFIVGDIALLPKSIVEILVLNGVIIIAE